MKISEINPHEVDYVLVATTDDGPFVDDVFYFIFAGDRFWRISSTECPDIHDWLRSFPSIDWDQSMAASFSTENRTFLLWRKNGPPVFTETVYADLKKRLASLLLNFGVSNDKALLMAESIMNKYGEPHRHYHNFRHIHHCLWELDRYPDDTINRPLVELAVWYHDVVYDPKRRDNELQSAQHLRDDLMSASPDVADKAYKMILYSAHTDAGTHLDLDTQVFLDIDMSILGQNPIEYSIYTQNIRLEYAHVPSLVFHYHRKKLLLRFLSGSIYFTDYYKNQYESVARSNLRDELKKKPYPYLPPWRRTASL